MAGEVYGSNHARMHGGPNQAGNKSMLSYNCKMAVPGYTGYIPSHSSIAIPMKSAERTGKPVDMTVYIASAMSTVTSRPSVSEYKDKALKVPSDTKPFEKSGGGYWFSQTTGLRSNPGPSMPFQATTTYQAETLNKEETTAKQMSCTKGLASTLTPYEVARSRAEVGSFGATSGFDVRPGSSLTKETTPRFVANQRPATSTTSFGDVVGYKTTKAAMVVPNPKTGGTATGGYNSVEGIVRPASTPEMRYQTVPRAMAPGMFGSASTYAREFGVDGSDPLRRSAPTARFMSRLSTTNDLAEGTARNTNHVPGYSGFVAQSKHSNTARAQSDAADERADVKSGMLLYSLDQLSRTRVPAYTGYKPQAPCNSTLVQPTRGANTETTFGDASYRATKDGVPHQDHSHYNNSNHGTMSFFTSKGTSISDNGIASAQQFFKFATPGEKGLRHSRELHKTVYGAPFNDRNSLV